MNSEQESFCCARVVLESRDQTAIVLKMMFRFGISIQQATTCSDGPVFPWAALNGSTLGIFTGAPRNHDGPQIRHPCHACLGCHCEAQRWLAPAPPLLLLVVPPAALRDRPGKLSRADVASSPARVRSPTTRHGTERWLATSRLEPGPGSTSTWSTIAGLQTTLTLRLLCLLLRQRACPPWTKTPLMPCGATRTTRSR